MCITHANNRIVNVELILPRRTPNTAYGWEIGEDNSVLLEDTEEERKRDLEYMRKEYSDCHIWQEIKEVLK